MLELFRSWVINIVILLLLIVLLEMIMPPGSLKKYINLVTGFILIIAIISPILKYFGSGTVPSVMINLESNAMDRKIIGLDSRLLEKEQARQITEVYRNKIIRQLENSSLEVEGVTSARADVIINEDYESDSFGEIKRAYIEVRSQKESSISSEMEKIRVVLGDSDYESELSGDETADGEKNAVKSSSQSETEEKLKEKISSIYGIDKDSIIISFR